MLKTNKIPFEIKELSIIVFIDPNANREEVRNKYLNRYKRIKLKLEDKVIIQEELKELPSEEE